jgi:hypothetical protein
MRFIRKLSNAKISNQFSTTALGHQSQPQFPRPVIHRLQRDAH